MSTYLSSFLRKTPIESLRAYFEDVSREVFAHVDWKAPRRSLSSSLTQTILALDSRASERISLDVDHIGQFANDQGRRMLRGVLPSDPEILSQFDGLEDVTACALFVMMKGSDVFDDALSAVYVQRLLNGREWTGFDFGPGIEPIARRDPPIAEFEERIREIFAADGPAPLVEVDRFSRREPDISGETVVREQFTIYIEDAPTAELAFTGATVEARIVRPVREGAVLFDAGERTLDVVGKRASKDQRREIADAFIELILEPGATLSERARRTLVLDSLKRRPVFDLRLEDRVRGVEVTKLALAAPNLGGIATFEVRGHGRGRSGPNLYDEAERAFGQGGILTRDGWPVISARLRILFEPENPKARAKSVVFELKAPDRTNLRDQIELHRRIADTLLARWGLYAEAI